MAALAAVLSSDVGVWVSTIEDRADAERETAKRGNGWVAFIRRPSGA